MMLFMAGALPRSLVRHCVVYWPSWLHLKRVTDVELLVSHCSL